MMYLPKKYRNKTVLLTLLIVCKSLHLLSQIVVVLYVISLQHCVLFTALFPLFDNFLPFLLLVIVELSLIVNQRLHSLNTTHNF